MCRPVRESASGKLLVSGGPVACGRFKIASFAWQAFNHYKRNTFLRNPARNSFSRFLWFDWHSPAWAVSTTWADQVVMKNGDRVTGSIVKQDGKTITVKSENFGLITAPWEQVASVQSDQPVTVVLKDGKTVAGALSTSDGKVRVATEPATVEVAPDDVAGIRNADEQTAYERHLKPGLFQLWAGGATLGWAGTNGNAQTLVSLALWTLRGSPTPTRHRFISS